MIAKNKVHNLMQKHNGDLIACFVTASEVYNELEKNGIKSNFWYKVIKELEKWKKNLEKKAVI
jgi:hypothetical protein